MQNKAFVLAAYFLGHVGDYKVQLGVRGLSDDRERNSRMSRNGFAISILCAFETEAVSAFAKKDEAAFCGSDSNGVLNHCPQHVVDGAIGVKALGRLEE